MYWTRTLLCFVFCFQSLIFIGQEDVKRILLVPYERFAFESEIPLETIGQVNGVKAEELVDVYWKHFLSFFSQGEEQLSFFQISEADRLMLSKRLQREFKTSTPSHYGVNLSTLEEGRLKQLLLNYSADYILFFTRYQIQKKLVYAGRSFDGQKFIGWSLHNVDYELYNPDGELIVIGDGVSIQSRNPQDDTYETGGILLKVLERGYELLAEDLYKKMKAYKGKPVFKLRAIRR